MRHRSNDYVDPAPAVRAGRRPGRLFALTLSVALLLLSAGNPVEAAAFRQGVSAFNRQDYVLASRILIPFAEQGQRAAQTYLGLPHELDVRPGICHKDS
jgi:hypothetical protein